MPYGVLLVTGAMTHQEGYAAGFRADPRCRILGVTDEAGVGQRRAEWNRLLASQLGVPYLEDLDAALARQDADLVSICTEHERQGRVAIRCAEAGKHIYIDKPLAASLDEARRLEQLVRVKRLRSQMFTQIHTPASQRVRRAILGGQLGQLLALHCDLFFAKGYSPAGIPLAPRAEHPAPGRFLYPDAKREMFNIAVYALALIRWASGRRDFRSVRAVTGNYFFEQNRTRDFEDFSVLALTLDGGLTATISAGRTGWRSHPGGGHNRVRLFGSLGSLLVDGAAAHGEIAGDSQPHWTTPAVNAEDPMGFWASTDQRKKGGPEWLAAPAAGPSDQSVFLDCLEKGREAECTVADGVKVLEALLAAYRSAATGETVSL